MTNQIAQLNDSQTMTTPEIAELTGKRHDNVMRVAKMLAERGIICATQIEERYNNNNLRKIYRLTKTESINLVANLSPEFTAAIIKRWHELETESLMEMIDRLAITQCSFKREQPHFVYLISDGDYIKIGVTNDIDQRVQSLQTGNPNQLTILTCIPCENARYIEGMLHGVFDDFKMQGEWFNLSESQIKIAVEKINKYRLKTLVNSKE